jgi:AcrR family transcriptional regulator
MREATQQSDKRRRRRGASLEAAILGAAWEELVAVGYPALTVEAVAARAHTSKPVLYRRWANRPELVLAAVRHHAKIASVEVPDTGSLRGDVLALLREVSERSAELAGLLSFLIVEYYRTTGLPPSVLRERMLAGGSGRMDVILRRAVERGEIREDQLNSRVVQLPFDLLRHDLIMTQTRMSDAGLVEIVDEVFLPLLMR